MISKNNNDFGYLTQNTKIIIIDIENMEEEKKEEFR
jgi:hypothetical protein